MNIIVNGLLISYQVSGSGPVIVCLHGWGDDNRTFDGLSTHLPKKFTVVRLDLPGFGGSQMPNRAWSLDDFAKCVVSFIKKLNLPKTYAVIGHSNGGAIAIKGLALGDLSAQKLILLASAGVRDEQTVKKTSLKILAKTGKVGAKILPKKHQAKLKEMLYSKAGSEMLLVPGMEETFKLVVGADVQADAKSLKLPTLLVYGDEDQATPVRFGQKLADQIKDSEFVAVGQAGHFVHLDKPAEVSDVITKFLEPKA